MNKNKYAVFEIFTKMIHDVLFCFVTPCTVMW